MSRAFVKEPDGDSPEQLPELPLSPYPNYVTARGLAQLHERLARSESLAASMSEGAMGTPQALAHAEREQRWLRSRISNAIVVDLAGQPRDQVAFGAQVELARPDDHLLHYRIVGEDESDPEAGLVSWTSPLARVLRGAHVGDVVTWPRPAGDLEIEVKSIDYPREAAKPASPDGSRDA